MKKTLFLAVACAAVFASAHADVTISETTTATGNYTDTGTLTIESGKKLSLNAYYPNSFTSVVLKGNSSEININNGSQTVSADVVLKNVTTSGSGASLIYANDLAGGVNNQGSGTCQAVQLTGTTTIANGTTLQLANYWSGKMAVDKLTGAGTLEIKQDNETGVYAITDMTEFTGTLKTSKNRVLVTATANMSSSQKMQEIYIDGGNTVSLTLGGTINVNNINTVRGTLVIAENATVTATNMIDMRGGNNPHTGKITVSRGATLIAANTANTGMWTSAAQGAILLEETGKFVRNGFTYTGLTGGGSLTFNDGKTNLESSDMVITGADISISADKTIRGTVTNGKLSAIDNALTLDGATLTNVTLAGNTRITVSGNTTINGSINNQTGGENKYAFVGSGSLIFTGTNDLTNGGTNQYANIGLGSSSTITVKEGATLKTTAIVNTTSNVTAANTQNNASVVVENKAVLHVGGQVSKNVITRLTNDGTTTITGTTVIGTMVNSGSLTMKGENTEMYSVTLSGGSVTLGSADPEGHDFKLTTSALAVTADSTLNANLKVNAGGTMDFSNHSVLTMGCSVEIGDSVIVKFDETELYAIQQGHALVIIDSVDTDPSTTLGKNWDFRGSDDRDLNGYGLFLSSEVGENGTWKVVVAPEPATATLSLLALAGLCARRRRH